jgi:hypothetical protein
MNDWIRERNYVNLRQEKMLSRGGLGWWAYARALKRILNCPLLSSPSPLLSLGVEYLKVLSLSVEPAYASLSVEPPKGTESLTIHMVRVR